MPAPILRLGSLLTVAALSFSAHTAGAADKAACAAAAEEGQRLLKAHKLVGAREQLLVCSSKDCPEIVVQDCTQWLGEVERGIASVVFRAVDAQGRPLDGVRVSENGVVVADPAGRAPVEVDPGSHVFRFERRSYAPAEQHVELGEGLRNQEVAVTMRAAVLAPPPPPPRRAGTGRGTGLFVVALSATGLAVAGGALYAGFGLAGLSDEDALKKTCAPYCTPAQTSAADTKFTIANVSLVAGLVSLAVAGVFWVLWGTSHPTPKHVGVSGATFVF
jgi:hypothetical protein